MANFWSGQPSPARCDPAAAASHARRRGDRPHRVEISAGGAAQVTRLACEAAAHPDGHRLRQVAAGVLLGHGAPGVPRAGGS